MKFNSNDEAVAYAKEHYNEHQNEITRKKQGMKSTYIDLDKMLDKYHLSKNETVQICEKQMRINRNIMKTLQHYPNPQLLKKSIFYGDMANYWLWKAFLLRAKEAKYHVCFLSSPLNFIGITADRKKRHNLFSAHHYMKNLKKWTNDDRIISSEDDDLLDFL